MIKFIVQFANIVVAGMIAGIQAEIWLAYDPDTFSFQNWLLWQQVSIQALNTIMPLLGLFTIILTLISAFFQKKNRFIFISLIIASGLLIGAGWITKFGNQPINKIVMTWNKNVIPADWLALSSRWRSFHVVRLLATLGAFCLIAFCSAKKNIQTAII